jgi:hypothetical protein
MLDTKHNFKASVVWVSDGDMVHNSVDHEQLTEDVMVKKQMVTLPQGGGPIHGHFGLLWM